MRWVDRLFGRAHRRGADADKVLQAEKTDLREDKAVLERRLKRIEATARAYGLDIPEKGST